LTEAQDHHVSDLTSETLPELTEDLVAQRP